MAIPFGPPLPTLSGTSAVALVTGAGSGIGRATARALAARGARVIVADINADTSAATVRELDGNRCRAVRLDVSDAGSVEEVFAEIMRTEGVLDIVHNNAGVASKQLGLHEVTAEEWNRVLGVNLTGAWNVLAAAIRVMRPQGGGAVVNTASIGSFSGLVERGPYCAAKAGVVALTKVAALENGGFGIRVNAVAPGTIATDMAAGALGGLTDAGPPPMGRLGTPEEVAEAVVWLCSNGASFINGTCLTVDGGWTVGVPPRAVPTGVST
jgi:NAD(P)-dependent dehydrogenase (short-subunit alcohol dehydrogenase family)